VVQILGLGGKPKPRDVNEVWVELTKARQGAPSGCGSGLSHYCVCCGALLRAHTHIDIRIQIGAYRKKMSQPTIGGMRIAGPAKEPCLRLN